MIKSKFIISLRQLSKHERKRFQKFVASPYFNTDQKLAALQQFIFDNLESPEQLRREVLFAHLFPESEFNYHAISNLVSYLTGHLEHFLQMEPAWR